MPYIFEEQKKLIPKELDRRIKLNEIQRIEIRKLYNTGKYSYRSLAKEYNVTKNTIRDAIYPEKAIEEKQKRLARAKEKNYYYDREKNNAYMKKHRAYKKQLHDDNLLLNNKKEEK